MTQIPVTWLTYSIDNPAKGRWDQAWLDRLLGGEEWRVPARYEFVEYEQLQYDRGGVVVFSAGHYTVAGEAEGALQALHDDLMGMPWCVLIATSDECSLFPWHLLDPWPEHVILWAQLPRVEHRYPKGTRFYGEGSPTSPRQIAHITKRGWNHKGCDVFISAQGGHDRRDQMFASIGKMATAHPELKMEIRRTSGFTEGLEVDVYLKKMADTWFAPAPSGICSQSSFRFFEALECQAIPIADGLRPEDQEGNGEGFWRLLGLDEISTIVDDWRDLPAVISGQHRSRVEIAGHVQSRWQQYKRRVAYNLDADVGRLSTLAAVRQSPDDYVTVIIPTSPVPSNPDLSIILRTIQSVRERLPHAEILITCDGVRDEQLNRAADYYEFVRLLAAWCNINQNVCLFTHPTHQHQSGMMRSILAEVHTPYVLYVEHDCPLEGDINFQDVLLTMRADEIASMRFHHEVEIHDTSAHLYLEAEGTDDRPYLRTVQWSQRPHLARTDWYRNIMGSFFGWESRTMIEDVMHSVIQHGHTGSRRWVREGWKKWRMAVWADGENIKHSGHLDARAGDPKYPMLVAYDAERPVEGPPEGWR